MPDQYQNIASFYDGLMADRADIPLITSLVAEFQPQAETLLELACGTGEILCHLSRKYDVVGVDSSEAMLALARYKMGHGRFVQGDMRNLKLEEKFDVVLCMFDSLNHLLRLAEWKQVFRVAKRHLAPGGIFMFDINTEVKFKRYIEESPFVDEFDENVGIFDVRQGKRGITELDIRVFQRVDDDCYRMNHSVIPERTFSRQQVKRHLSELFSKVNVRDENGESARSNSESLYFICRL